MRRAFLLSVLAALVAVPAASGAFQPIRRNFGELQIPRLRAGTLTIPKAHRDGRIRVIVSLSMPPLAQAYGRGLAAAGTTRQLNAHTTASREYIRRVAAAQERAIARLRKDIPSARVSWRYQIVLDGFTVTLPVKKLPALAHESFAQRVWPSLTYHLALNRSPAVIGADIFHQRTGANGEGVKIGIVDDGIDNTNVFLNGDGFTAPPGFPIGDPTYTNNKVIVARDFPGPGAATEPGGTLPLDRKSSFHGTHVAGIAAGDANTCAPAGADHPATCGLSGVAPKAYLGNYRVFNVPTPVGHIAESPEIAEAFEAAVADGMNVINFSGGGPQSEPLNDVLIAVIDNVAAAGVLPVIAAGNDRDDFGFGTVGSPGTAPAAISVAAVSNSQVFAPAISAFSGGVQVLHAPIQTRGSTPAAWETSDQLLVDVGSILGRSGGPVERHLCGSAGDPNGPGNDLPAHSLDGAIALVLRGSCTFASKAQRAKDAGAIGIILVDNRAGEANPIPLDLGMPSGMVADIDGAALRAAMTSGRVVVRIGKSVEDIATGRSGVITSFSSAGPTAFGHLLKPDVAAPGGQILSSTLPEFTGGSPFAVFDGTSMATPHVVGAAALLVQRHPTWSPQQLKSALMSTAGAAWSDTARLHEAPVTEEGAGLINVMTADDPQVFTDPASLSLGELDVNKGAASRGLLLRVTDAGDGAGTWTATLQSQSATAGVTLSIPSLITITAGGEADVSVVAQASAGAPAGDEMGFVVLTKGSVSRRVPYYFEVTRPALESVPATELKTLNVGDTVTGTSRVSAYRWPSWAFGPPPTYTGSGENEPGAERLYTTLLSQPAINFGVSVVAQSNNSLIDPWVLGSPDENDVQGYAGTPVNVNSLMYDFRADVESAATVFPLTKRYYVAVDSGSDPFTGQSLAGQYVLRAWVDDLTPPALTLLTTKVASGRSTIVARATDTQSGVDPLSLVLAYDKALLGASAYDPTTGIVLFSIPPAAPALKTGTTKETLSASDFQEAKNVNTIGTNILPNTQYKNGKITVIDGPALTWVVPLDNACIGKPQRLLVAASSTKNVSQVTFFVDGKQVGVDKTATVDLFSYDWAAKTAKKGKHVVRATMRDASGRTATLSRTVRVC
ncbi:MAG: S8 family serine peptidase [Gaiellaceae bacterium]